MTEIEKQWQGAFEHLASRNFQKATGHTPEDVYWSWPDAGFKPTTFVQFCNWALHNSLNPLAEYKEVHAAVRGGKTVWQATAMGGMRGLFRRGVITGILQECVVYEDENYRFVNGRIEHEQTVNVYDHTNKVHMAWMLVRLANGDTREVRLSGSQLDHSSRNTGKNVWQSHRHEMYLAALYRYAAKKLAALDVAGPPMSPVYDDLEDEPVTAGSMAVQDGPPPMEAPNADEFLF